MNTNLGFCLALHRAHASLQLKPDDELGMHHGKCATQEHLRMPRHAQG
jgi:hypothetical protein